MATRRMLCYSTRTTASTMLSSPRLACWLALALILTHHVTTAFDLSRISPLEELLRRRSVQRSLDLEMKIRRDIQPLLIHTLELTDNLMKNYELDRLELYAQYGMLDELELEQSYIAYEVENLPDPRTLRQHIVPEGTVLSETMKRQMFQNLPQYCFDLRAYGLFIDVILSEELSYTLDSQAMENYTSQLRVIKIQGIIKLQNDVIHIIRELQQDVQLPTEDNIVPVDFRYDESMREIDRHFRDYLVLHRCKKYLEGLIQVFRSIVSALQRDSSQFVNIRKRSVRTVPNCA